MSQRISQNELQDLRTDVMNILSKLDTMKYRINSGDHRLLVNNFQYTISTLNNMSNTLTVELSDPYNSGHLNYTPSKSAGKHLKYNKDGTSNIIDESEFHTTGDGWEKQFNDSQMINPPCYIVPPQNINSIPKIRKTSEFHRIAELTERPEGYRNY
uniref:Uncharacterized protein n=1 Tax=viral metagenome TaxID=1070528 RepID=A0A6C0J4X8_9ZZZZ